MTDQSGERPATVCPRCAVGCHLARPADGPLADGVAGPANPEGRLCEQGVSAFDGLEDDRLTRPLVRRNGDHEPVAWATALEAVAERFGAILEADGPDALAFLGAPHSTTEENYLLGKLARLVGTNNVDNRARLCHADTARALSDRLGWPATTGGLEHLAAADVIVVAGANPAERQPVAFNGFVRPAVNDGATLVHVDPVGNRTTRLADVHLAPRPGTDALVFDLLSAHVLDAGGVDSSFVAERTRGAEAFAAALADRDPDRVARVAGVDRDEVARVGDHVAGADRVAALVGTGIEDDAGGGDAAGGATAAGTGSGSDGAAAPGALLDLLLLTGNFGRPGTGLYVLRGLVNEQGATDAGCVPDRLPGHQPVTDPAARARVESEWGRPPPAEPGLTATEMLAAFGDGIRGALVVGENPAVSKRESDWVRRRLAALDALVVLDVAPNRTTRHADVVLPAAAGVEKAGTVTSLDRRVQRLRPTAAPPGEARPDFAVLCDIGGRLVDDADQFAYPDVGAAFDELARVAPTHAGGSDAGGRRWPFDGDDVLYRDAFATADGRAPFRTPGPVAEPAEGDGLRLVTGGRTGEFAADAAAVLRMHPADAGERGLAGADAVAVAADDVAVTATVDPDEAVRRGTVYLPAPVADPLLRVGAETVTVEPASPAQ